MAYAPGSHPFYETIASTTFNVSATKSSILLCDVTAAGASIVVTLPSTHQVGAIHIIKLIKLTASRTVTIARNGNLIDWSASDIVLSNDNQGVTFISDGTNWWSYAVTGSGVDVTLAGSYDYLTIAGQVITRNQIDLATDVVIASEAQGDILYRGASAWSRLAAGTDGKLLKTSGSGANPSWVYHPIEIIFHPPSTSISLLGQPNSEQFLQNSANNIKKVDLTDKTQVRMLLRLPTASGSGNSPRIYLEYHTAFSTTLGDYVAIGSSAVECSLTAAGFIDTGWINLVAGAKADVFIAILQNGGQTTPPATPPSIGGLCVQFR